MGAHRIATVVATIAIAAGSVVAGTDAPVAARPGFSPGAPGAGDPYFPKDGNGGYDARHYRLDLRYMPARDRLRGTATMRARATKNLSRFNLDLRGLHVRSVRVEGRRAHWVRRGSELRVTPRHGLRRGHVFHTRIRYASVPRTLSDGSGFVHTDDGALIIGQPHVAATWFPVSDHPSDKAAYSFRMTVPRGRQVIANGLLRGHHRHGRWTTWHWVERRPMASYLATASVGQWRFFTRRHRGIRIVDAIDPDLLRLVARPRTGRRMAISQKAEGSYKRLTRTVAVPADGGSLSFWVHRRTEPEWDFFFVEAHTVGQSDWTTLPDENGHTTRDVGASCPEWLDLHPFLRHYQTREDDGSCSPTGTTGRWSAASGESDGYEHWRVDLSRYASEDVEISLSYASDPLYQFPGVFVDDIRTPTGDGSTSFERDGNVRDGWSASGPPAGSPGNDNNWIAGTIADVPANFGQIARRVFRREGEILDFLAGRFGRYPFRAAGGIVDDVEGLGFALENQTRPIYDLGFFSSPASGAGVVVHELAHQWYGDSLAVQRWRNIWLNEGFATYAEWMWSKHEGGDGPQKIFESDYTGIPPTSDFWKLRIGNPGPDNLFDGAVYERGAMTLQQLRNTVGHRAFFRILRRWAARNEDGNVRTREFIALAERISGRQLDRLFHAWLYTARRPAVPGMRAASRGPASQRSVRPELRRMLAR